MKITDVEVIQFRTTTRGHPTKWGYGVWGDEVESVSAITRFRPTKASAGICLGETKQRWRGLSSH